MSLADRVRALIEGLLPWYDADLEARRDAHSRRIQRFSIAARIKGEKALKSYGRVSVHR